MASCCSLGLVTGGLLCSNSTLTLYLSNQKSPSASCPLSRKQQIVLIQTAEISSQATQSKRRVPVRSDLQTSQQSFPSPLQHQGFGVQNSLHRRQHLSFGPKTKGISQVVVGEGGCGPTLTSESELEAERVKTELRKALEGVNRGIFGVQSAKKAEIEELIRELEALNPLEEPTQHLDKVAGEWRLLYSTISILGSRRTKLGLREFVKLGDFRQVIDPENNRAVNVVEFSVTGIGFLGGSLTIEASYSVASPNRVAIAFERSAIVPEQLLSLFQKNYDLLLNIFNPEGWLDITYVDANVRVGRDNKGNVFLVERTHGNN